MDNREVFTGNDIEFVGCCLK